MNNNQLILYIEIPKKWKPYGWWKKYEKIKIKRKNVPIKGERDIRIILFIILRQKNIKRAKSNFLKLFLV